MVNTSTTLTRKHDGWWLTLSSDEQVHVETPKDAPGIGLDVGIANFISTATGQQYGPFHGKLAARHKRDREQRRRKAKLRACLKNKGVKKLPSTRNKKLARQQEITRAVNELYREHPDAQFAYEHLNVAGMRFTARRMNASLYASNLAHIPAHLAWGAAKRGVRAGECLFLSGMPSLSLCVPREPAHPANVLLGGLRADQPCRQKRGRKPGESSGRSRASCLRRTQGDHGAFGQTTPGVDAESTTVGRSTTARPVLASTGVGERVKCLMIFRSTIQLVMQKTWLPASLASSGGASRRWRPAVREVERLRAYTVQVGEAPRPGAPRSRRRIGHWEDI
jgi:hypothetical protein